LVIYHQTKARRGTELHKAIPIKINKVMAAARSDPQARKTWAAAGLLVADQNGALAEWRKAATRTEGAAMRKREELQKA
jgi:hypothetical protein